MDAPTDAAAGLTLALSKMHSSGGPSIITNPTASFYFVTVLTLTTGTAFNLS